MDEQVKLPPYFTTVLRIIGGILAGYILKTGLISADQLPEIGAGAMALAVLLWGLWAKRQHRVALVDAIAAPAGQATPKGGSLNQAKL